jgi:hypothetical protein
MTTVSKTLLSLLYRFNLIRQKIDRLLRKNRIVAHNKQKISFFTPKVLPIQSSAVPDMQFSVIYPRAVFIFPIKGHTEPCRIMIGSRMVMTRSAIFTYYDDKVDAFYG